MYLVCHVTSQDELTGESCEFMARSFLWFVTTFLRLVTTDIVIVKMFLICHVTSCGHIFEGLCEFMDESPLT